MNRLETVNKINEVVNIVYPLVELEEGKVEEIVTAYKEGKGLFLINGDLGIYGEIDDRGLLLGTVVDYFEEEESYSLLFNVLLKISEDYRAVPFLRRAKELGVVGYILVGGLFLETIEEEKVKELINILFSYAETIEEVISNTASVLGIGEDTVLNLDLLEGGLTEED